MSDTPKVRMAWLAGDAFFPLIPGCVSIDMGHYGVVLDLILAARAVAQEFDKNEESDSGVDLPPNLRDAFHTLLNALDRIDFEEKT